MKRSEYLQNLTPQYFYEFLRNFSLPHIAEQWRKARNHYTDDNNYCPVDDDEVLKLWLDEEVENNNAIVNGYFIKGQSVTVLIDGKQVTRKVHQNSTDGLYILYNNMKYFEYEFED